MRAVFFTDFFAVLRAGAFFATFLAVLRAVLPAVFLAVFAALFLTVLKAEATTDLATGEPVVSITFDAASTEEN